jgi:hypothetical protein
MGDNGFSWSAYVNGKAVEHSVAGMEPRTLDTAQKAALNALRSRLEATLAMLPEESP